MLDDAADLRSTLQNPPDASFNWFGVFFFMVIFGLGVIISTVIHRPIMVVIGAFMGLLAPLAIVWTEYVARPTRVHIGKDGVRLEYRFIKPKDVQWKDIVWIYVSPKKYTSVTGKDKRRGILQLKRMKLTTLVTYDIGLAMRSAYQRYHGPLPELPDDWKNQPY